MWLTHKLRDLRESVVDLQTKMPREFRVQEMMEYFLTQEISPPSGFPGRFARASSDANLINDLGEFDPPSPISPHNSMHRAFQADPNDSNFPGSIGPFEQRARYHGNPADFGRRLHYSSSIVDSLRVIPYSILLCLWC